MKRSRYNKAKPGRMVVLTRVPPGLLRGLPKRDMKAISAIVGKRILLVGYDDDGRAELKFTDSDDVIHFIYVNPTFIRAAKAEGRIQRPAARGKMN
jgi:hypothetical protein